MPNDLGLYLFCNVVYLEALLNINSNCKQFIGVATRRMKSRDVQSHELNYFKVMISQKLSTIGYSCNHAGFRVSVLLGCMIMSSLPQTPYTDIQHI